MSAQYILCRLIGVYPFGAIAVRTFATLLRVITGLHSGKEGPVGSRCEETSPAFGLLRPSVLKPVVATLERSLVVRKLGQLVEEDRAALRKVLAEILAG